MTWREMARAAQMESDNAAANLLLKELGGPAYLGPDVTADFSTVALEQVGAACAAAGRLAAQESGVVPFWKLAPLERLLSRAEASLDVCLPQAGGIADPQRAGRRLRELPEAAFAFPQRFLR